MFFPSIPSIAVAQKLIGGVNTSTLLAIPFFVFAADIMARGTIAERLTDLVKIERRAPARRARPHHGRSPAWRSARSADRRPRPSPRSAVCCIRSWSRPATREKFSLGLIASSAECALLIPPSITLIIYGWLTGTSIADLFAAGLAVGIVLGHRLHDPGPDRHLAHRRRRLGARHAAVNGLPRLRDGLVALGLPFIILGGIYGGVFTATEAAAVAVVYALTVEVLIYRSFGFRELMEVSESSAITVVVIFILLAMGSVLSFFITLAQVPAFFTQLFADWNVNWIVFLLIVNVILLIAGMFIDPNSILLVLIPTFYPVAVALGIDPVHFGLIVCLNICIGMITPPFGLDLFVASSTLRRPVEAVIAGVWPFIATNIIILVLITYIPQISTAILKITR